MSAASSSANYMPWLEKLWEDLQPTPGRLNSSLRITLATVLALVLILVWQMPFAAIGLYSIFLIGRESPSVSLRLGVASVMTVALAVAIELSVVLLTDNDPMARVLSVAAIAFLAGMVVVGTSLPALGPSWGLIYSIVIAFWESHLPADRLVKNSLWLLATFSVAVGCGIAVEYVFGARSPADRLEEQLRIRYQALERMFSLYARDAQPEQRFEAAGRVSRLAVAGQDGMMALYNQIVDRNLDTGALPIGTRVHIAMLAELMDESAAFGLQSQMRDDSDLRQRCARIAEQCRGLIQGDASHSEGRFESGRRVTNGLLDRVEAAIHSILVMPSDVSPAKNKELATLPSKAVPLFIPGAIRDRDNVTFSLKISLCATICYILYHAIDWPGTSSSVITVMVTGLTTTGAMKQRLMFRLLGATVGGLILGLGATAFVFPELDSITSLAIVVGSVAFVAAWISGGPRFNYVGIQLAFAFYIVAFEGFSAPTQLAPARDRLFGILFALVVMWFVFDQIWPVRTVTAMRRVLASVLRSGASFFQMVDSAKQHDQFQREMDSVRDRVGKNISALRTMSEAVEYEFGVDREQHVRTSELILRSSLTAAALIWNQVAVLHDKQELPFLAEPGLAEMRRRLADRLNMLAEAVERKTSLPAEHLGSLVSRHLLENEHYGEYARNTIARYEDLQTLASQLRGEI
jgi:multidrug resistance protein MdtO